MGHGEEKTLSRHKVAQVSRNQVCTTRTGIVLEHTAAGRAPQKPGCPAPPKHSSRSVHAGQKLPDLEAEGLRALLVTLGLNP